MFKTQENFLLIAINSTIESFNQAAQPVTFFSSFLYQYLMCTFSKLDTMLDSADVRQLKAAEQGGTIGKLPWQQPVEWIEMRNS